jgi:hypothetical protein
MLMKELLKKHPDLVKGYKIGNLISAIILPAPITIKVLKITICLIIVLNQ